MDIRKHIIILCLLCCHALGVMADGQLVQNYTPISRQDAEQLFYFRDTLIRVTGISYGSYKLVGKGRYSKFVASSKTSRSHYFALKVECDVPSKFDFKIREEIDRKFASYSSNSGHTLFLDGQAKVLPQIKRYNSSESRTCELPAGKHEIVIKSNLYGKLQSPISIECFDLRLHAHDMVTESTETARCGRDGRIKRKCKKCRYSDEVFQPMPAAEHEFVVRELIWKGSCRTPDYLTRDCTICGLFQYKARKHDFLTHNFQNGRCVNKGCEIKLPSQNAENIYQVGDAYELRGLAEQIAAGEIPCDCNFDLTADITYPEGMEHCPIGTTDYPFAGTFDGHGHHIGNMQSATTTDMTGLFGVVKGLPTRLAVIANVIIDSSSNPKGTNMVGAVAGRADYCDIMRCVNRATVTGYDYVGGIVGYSGRECHLIDCAGLGGIKNHKNGGLLSGTLLQSYIMDSYGGIANSGEERALAPKADSYLRHCFLLDAKDPTTGVTPFSSAQLSDGTLARMLCEKNGKDMPAHWQQGATDGCPMPVFVALTDRPSSVIQPQAETRAVMSASSVELYNGEEDVEDEKWHSFSWISDIIGGSPDEDFVFYDEADSTLNDFTCYVTTTFRNVPAMPMFAAMQGGDASECNVIYCKNDSTVIMEYNYTIDGKLYSLTDATKQYTTPDSVVHLESYAVEGNEGDDEFLMTSNMVFCPDGSGYEEEVSHGVATKVMDWEIVQNEDMEPVLNFYFYDEDGQQRIDEYSLHDKADEGDNSELPIDVDYTLDEYGRLMDLHYVFTDPLTGEKYNIGGQYYIYDEKGELLQAVSYEPVAPHSCEMRQTEYTTFESYNADHPSAIIPIEQLQPGTLDGSSTRTSTHVYDMRGNLVRLSNDAAALKSLPKGIYITRGRKILVR